MTFMFVEDLDELLSNNMGDYFVQLSCAFLTGLASFADKLIEIDDRTIWVVDLSKYWLRNLSERPKKAWRHGLLKSDKFSRTLLSGSDGSSHSKSTSPSSVKMYYWQVNLAKTHSLVQYLYNKTQLKFLQNSENRYNKFEWTFNSTQTGCHRKRKHLQANKATNVIDLCEMTQTRPMQS